jgi:hypothetical protein
MTNVIIIILGLIFTGLGIFSLLRLLNLKKSCTARVEGTVTGIEKKEGLQSGKRHTSYYLIFTYSVDDREYIKTSTSSHSRNTPLGKSVIVFYNPSNPDKQYLKSDVISITVGSPVFIIFGIIAMILGFFTKL